jgi:hypothetical protein
MAYVSRLADYVRGGVVGESILEGLAVVLTTSGAGLHGELPVLLKASQNQVGNIGILIKGPDDFTRPTLEGMYTAPSVQVQNWNQGFTTPVRTEVSYQVGKSVLWSPTLVSGELGLFMRGGTFAVPSGAYIMSANIRVPGNMIRVGTGGLWEYTATESQAVGYVEEYQPALDVLIFTLRQ